MSVYIARDRQNFKRILRIITLESFFFGNLVGGQNSFLNSSVRPWQFKLICRKLNFVGFFLANSCDRPKKNFAGNCCCRTKNFLARNCSLGKFQNSKYRFMADCEPE